MSTEREVKTTIPAIQRPEIVGWDDATKLRQKKSKPSYQTTSKKQ